MQVAAYPDAYADDEPLARRLLAEIRADASSASGTGAQTTAAQLEASSSCTSDLMSVAAGDQVFPQPRGTTYLDQRNFAQSGSHWVATHTGTDLSTACGTPVLAATAGTVIIETDQSWAGRWLVEVSTPSAPRATPPAATSTSRSTPEAAASTKTRSIPAPGSAA